MTPNATEPKWQTIAILTGRVIFAAVFLVAVIFKFASMEGTAGYIASAGFPFSYFLAWVAAIFECVLIFCFLTGAFFSEASLIAGIYVIFLGFVFHGPSHWTGNQMEFGLFVNHFTFLAGLLFAAAKGPGHVLSLRHTIIGKT